MHYKSSILYIDIVRLYLEEHSQIPVELNDFFPSSDNLKERVPLRQVLDAWGEVSKFLADPILGSRIGSLLDLSEYGVFSHALMHAPNLYEALLLIHNYRYMMNDAFEGSLIVEDGVVNYTLELPVGDEYSYLLIEFHFSSIIKLGRDISARKLRHKVVPMKVDFAHPPMAPIEEYRSVLGAEVNFNQKHNVLSIPIDVLLSKTQFPNPTLYNFFLKNIDRVYRLNLNPKIITHQLYRIFSAKDPDESWPTQSEVAHALNMSLSTLKRRLQQEDCSFQYVLDSYRFKTAKSMLRQGMSIEELSHQMGFSTTASLGRAFKRWGGLTISEYLNS